MKNCVLTIFFFCRDLKPSNILLAEDGQTWKISDFGLAKKLDTDLQIGPLDITLKASHTAEIGTFSYMAPELQDGRGKYDHKIDIFSMGLIALEMFVAYHTKMEKMDAFGEARNGNIPNVPKFVQQEKQRKCYFH